MKFLGISNTVIATQARSLPLAREARMRNAAIAKAKRLEANKASMADIFKYPYKKYTFKNPMKTKIHRIITGMKLRFKDGSWVHYDLGKIDTVVTNGKNFHHALTYDRFRRSIFKGYQSKLFTPDEDEDIKFEYTEEEKCAEALKLAPDWSKKHKDLK